MSHTDTNIIPSELGLRIKEKITLLHSMPPLPTDVIRKRDEELKVLHTYYSNAIDGNSLDLSETESVVTEGMTIEATSLPEHREAVNTATAFERMETLAREGAPISHATIQGIHAVVIGADSDGAGKYRRANVRGAGKAHPVWTEVRKLMNQLILTVEHSRLHPIETSAFFYHRFVDIHPFTDGNGRVARLLVCLYLIEHNYPAVILKKESRKKYTQLVKAADAGDIGPFSAYIAKAVDESLSLSLAAYGGDDELIPVEDIAEDTPYSPEYLRLWAEQGLLDAVTMEHACLTSRRALERYFAVHGTEEI
ncbi:Fic family protein [Methanogenium cariaci]|jgi:cell filamentation protein, protein adenylyltransferase